MLFLGFADDVLDVRWSVKLLLSFLAAFPLIMAYDGPTNIIVPIPLRSWFGYDITLGIFYLLYMEILAVFCTNAINIYAGINGLETGQAVVLALEILIHNYLELDGQSPDHHLMSLFLMLPFFMVTFALFYYNKYVVVSVLFCVLVWIRSIAKLIRSLSLSLSGAHNKQIPIASICW
jgi:UDP-N-acetylglucosamine--dolichyl-phosphate N-acetylglucosaminephosphotransferase